MKDYSKILNAPLTTKQQKACELAIQMTQKKAAKHMRISERCFRKLLNRASKAYETYHGLDAETGASKGIPAYNRSTLIKLENDPEGRALIWKKEKGDPAAFAQGLLNNIERLIDEDFHLPSLSPPADNNSDLMDVIIITDSHVGMLACQEEGGENYDVRIAEKRIYNATDDLFSRAKSMNSTHCVVCFLGDLMHYDGLEAVTPAHRNLLDADSRYFKMIDVSYNVVAWVALRALQNYQTVDLLVAEGNHDLSNAAMMQKSFEMIFAKEQRINVIRTPKPYYCFTWGNTLVACHHGHLKNKENFGASVSELFRKEWGRTKYAYALQGHVHSSHKKEANGIITETFPTLAARDSYASRHAYFSQSGATLITYHKKHGEYGRITTRPISTMTEVA